MTKRKPSYCPYCGTGLATRAFEERERRFCPTCQEFIFQNPVPVARVVVLDGDSVLFVKRAQPPYQGRWTIPGGVLEVDESAARGATRELEEETFVRTSAEDVELVYTDLTVDALDQCFYQDRLNVLVGDELGNRGERYCFVLVNTQIKPHVDCGVHGAPRWLDTRGDPVLTGVSCY